MFSMYAVVHTRWKKQFNWNEDENTWDFVKSSFYAKNELKNRAVASTQIVIASNINFPLEFLVWAFSFLFCILKKIKLS